MRAAVCLAGSLLSFTAAAMEQNDGTYLYGDREPRPAPVMALQDCAANDQTPASRRPFAGGYVFAIKCASNHANWVETLIFSEHEDGTGAWLLLFPGPEGRRDGFEELLSNVRWNAETAEIGETSVDPENARDNGNLCRSEGRWRLEGKRREPKLVYWRETADCDGNSGWRVLVPR